MASDSYGDGWSTCGDRTFAITDSSGATPSWVTAVTVGAATNTITIRVVIDDETYIGSSPHTMSMTVGFANYPTSDDAQHPTRTYTFDITVVAAVCDCTLVTWDAPVDIPRVVNAMVVTTPATQELDEAGPLESSLTDTSGARACDHANDECDFHYTISAKM